jgi:hypothetical protein
VERRCRYLSNVSLFVPKRYVYIADLAERLHARSNPWKGIAVLWAYFDDAGTHASSEVTTIGGLLGTKAAWTALEADWQIVINDFREYGLTAFHAYDCEEGLGEFASFPVEIRHAISARFARLVAQHSDLRIFWSSCVNAAWDEAADAAFKQRYISPFGLCFEFCVQQTARWCVNYAGGTPVSLIFSEQTNFRDRINDVFRYYVGAKAYAPLRTLTFGSYRDLIPLQAADQIATEMNRYWRAAELNPEKLALRPEIVELERGRGLHLGGCYDRLGIANAVRQYHHSSAEYADEVAGGMAPPEDAYTDGWSVKRLRSVDSFVLMPPEPWSVPPHGAPNPENPEPAHFVRLRSL